MRAALRLPIGRFHRDRDAAHPGCSPMSESANTSSSPLPTMTSGSLAVGLIGSRRHRCRAASAQHRRRRLRCRSRRRQHRRTDRRRSAPIARIAPRAPRRRRRNLTAASLEYPHSRVPLASSAPHGDGRAGTLGPRGGPAVRSPLPSRRRLQRQQRLREADATRAARDMDGGHADVHPIRSVSRALSACTSRNCIANTRARYDASSPGWSRRPRYPR
jgi:hypothetical protein